MKRYKTIIKGFTLIEIIVILSIVLVLGMIGFASFAQFGNAQSLQSGAEEVITFLNAARTRAISEVKPTQCAGKTLNGYQVSLTAPGRQYELDVLCGGNTYQIAAQQLPANTAFLQGSYTPVILHYGNGTTSPGKITINGYQWSKVININGFGNPNLTTTALQPTPTPVPTATPTPTPNGVLPTATPTPVPTVTSTPTPTPCASTLAQDTFTRANQSHWGTASDGQAWGADASSNSFFSITGNTGTVTDPGNNNDWDGVLGPVITDAEVLTTGSYSNFSGTQSFAAILRWTNSNNWYKAYLGNHNQFIIEKLVGGVYTDIASTAFTATAGTNYSIRFRVVGTTLSAKVWQTSGSEPGSWTLTRTDGSFSSGRGGIHVANLAGATAAFTSFKLSAITCSGP